MICTCKEWEENISKINAPMVLQSIRRGTKGYDGIIFRYCPWCGSVLREYQND